MSTSFPNSATKPVIARAALLGTGASRSHAFRVAWGSVEALSSIQARKQCIHGPLAAVKASVPQARELTLALVNLARAAEVTATSWCFRRINPLHKSGPRVVRKLKCLRPISLTADMAAVQDALWLARCKQQLEAYTDLRQAGHRLDHSSGNSSCANQALPGR